MNDKFSIKMTIVCTVLLVAEIISMIVFINNYEEKIETSSEQYMQITTNNDLIVKFK